MAKRKQRGSPAGGGGGARLLSSMPGRLSRTFPREPRPESQAKRVATLIPLEDSSLKQRQQRPAMHSPAAAGKADAAAAKVEAEAATARTATVVTLNREDPINNSRSSSSSMARSSSVAAGDCARAANFAETNLRSSPLKEGEMDPTIGGALLTGPVRSVARGEHYPRGPEREEPPRQPGVMPSGSGSRPALGAVSPASPATAGGAGVQDCCAPSSPPPAPLSGNERGAPAVSPTPPTNGSGAACAAVNGAAPVSGGINGSAAGAGVGQDSKQAALKAMMFKAKMASDNIRLLLHAKVSRPAKQGLIRGLAGGGGRGGRCTHLART